MKKYKIKHVGSLIRSLNILSEKNSIYSVSHKHTDIFLRGLKDYKPNILRPIRTCSQLTFLSLQLQFQKTKI